jgi:biopolymer transport protein ExbB
MATMTPRLTRTFLRRATMMRLTVLFAVACMMTLVFAGAAIAQGTTGAPATPAAANAPAAEGGRVSLWELFSQSFDLFTVLLVVGSLAGWTIIIICMIEVRKSNVAPDEPVQIISGLCKAGRWNDLRTFVDEDDALVSRVVRAGMAVPTDDKDAVREAAELAASEEAARWFRKVEPLNVIGNLGPLLGLSGTVWGMIIAFAALGQSGGQASPANLSLGISKALFHTLLGLLLAVPCLTIYGFYRSLIDKLCTRAMVAASDLVEMLPREARLRNGEPKAAGPGGAANTNAAAAARAAGR